jgi:hypothetical protein
MKRPCKAVDLPALLARETRLVPFARSKWRLLLGYPSPYRVGMSSLGYLTLHRQVPAHSAQWSPDAELRDIFLVEVERRLRRVRTGLGGRVRIQPASARWAWVEARIAQGDEATGEAVLRAWEQGGKYADFKRELSE